MADSKRDWSQIQRIFFVVDGKRKHIDLSPEKIKQIRIGMVNVFGRMLTPVEFKVMIDTYPEWTMMLFEVWGINPEILKHDGFKEEIAQNVREWEHASKKEW